MRKPHLSVLLFICLNFGLTTLAGAIPIGFDIDGSGSGASVFGSGVGSITSALDANLDFRIFSLGDGESYAFDFFTLTVIPSRWGIGGGTASVSATLAFERPTGAGPFTGDGNGWWFSLLGSLSGGKLHWDDSLPQTIVLASGDSFDVDYSDISDFGLGNSATVQAIVTAHAAAPVPEPATILLLAPGLVWLAGSWRKPGNV